VPLSRRRRRAARRGRPRTCDAVRYTRHETQAANDRAILVARAIAIWLDL
jgi:hypothetical protein